MPLRIDPTLWFNLPGVVAAYQPVGAPGPTLACYNQAMGGRNLYKAIDGVAPTWSSRSGWVFNGSTQYLATGVVPDDVGTLVIKFIDATLSGDYVIIGSRVSGSTGMFIQNSNSASRVYINGAFKVITGGKIAAGIMAVAYNQGYLNGLPDGTTFSVTPYAITHDIYIGCLNNAGSPIIYRAAKVQTVAYYNRTLSAAEVWSVSRQMAYCDVNPDWSAWGRRRKWFYAPEQPAVDLYVGPFQDVVVR